MSRCPHGRDIRHQSCYACEDIAEAEMKATLRAEKAAEKPLKKDITKAITPRVMAYVDGSDIYFENSRGPMVNGNRRIHMNNWKLCDLRAIVRYLEAQPKCKVCGKRYNPNGFDHCGRPACTPY